MENNSDQKRKDKLFKELDRIVSKIKELDVEKIILFGSTALGKIHRLSDIDLIIVKKTDKRFLERLDEVYSHLQPRCSVDILVYTPDEFLHMKENNNFLKDAVSEGKIIYEKK